MECKHMTTILEAHYRNGRWGTQRASVFVEGGRAYFNNGFADSLCCRSLADAEAHFHSFLADMIPADALAMRMMEF